jgi:general secretion pathway protein M
MNAQRLADWYRGLAPREQRFVLVGGIAIAILAVLLLVLPPQRALARLAEQVDAKRDDLEWLQSMAPQIAAAAANAPRPQSGGSLVVLIDRSAKASGIGDKMVSSQPNGDGAMRVRFEAVAFDSLVGWMSEVIQRDGVRVDSATVDGTATPGRVNATLVLRGG